MLGKRGVTVLMAIMDLFLFPLVGG